MPGFARLKERLLETPVDLKVHFGDTTITGNQLLQEMQVGDVLVLDTDVEDLLTAAVAGVKNTRGIAGTVKAMKAFQIIKRKTSPNTHRENRDPIFYPTETGKKNHKINPYKK